MAGQDNDVAIRGGQILGDEFSDHVVKVSGSRCSSIGCIVELWLYRTAAGSFYARGTCFTPILKLIQPHIVLLIQHPSQIRPMAQRIPRNGRRRPRRDQLPQHPRHHHLRAWSTLPLRYRRSRPSRQTRPSECGQDYVDRAQRGTDCVYQWSAVLLEEGEVYAEEFERWVGGGVCLV